MSWTPPPDSGMLPLAGERQLAAARSVDWPRYVIGLGLFGYGVLIIAAMGTGSFALIVPIPLIPVLAFVAYRLGLEVAERDRDPAMARFVFAAFWAKMLGTLIRSLVVSQVYDNRSDSLDYHEWGKFFAPQFRGFDFSNIVSWSGTEFMRTMTGFVYAFTGASQVSGAIVFSFLSFLGLLLMWRAFRRTVPTGLGYRYGVLVLFLPSMLYWPSAIGKEGWAIFCLGLASYGVARVLTRSIPLGLVIIGAGIFGVSLVRPHVALTIFSGVALAAALGKSQRPGVKTSALRLVLFGALVVLGLVLASSTAEFFGVPSLNQETGNEILNEAEGRTSEAGSAFSPVRMSNPANVPLAIVTVLFRPFPFEASSAVSAASSIEGVALFGLMCVSWRRLLSVPRCMRNQPYVAYCIGILITFIYAFSSFSNFGILARQRVQVLPFFLALACLPVWQREGVISTEEAMAGRDESRPASLDDTIAPDPYPAEPQPTDWRSPSDAGTHDPYGDADFGLDPYRRFRENPDQYRPDDA